MKTALLYPYRKKDFTGCNPPISLLYLAASLLEGGEDVSVIDMDDGDLSMTDMVRKVTEFSPGLVGIPVFSTNLPEAYKLVELLDPERFGWKILLGGPHPTARPKEVLEAFPKCDFVLRGESEQSIAQLVKALDGHNGLDSVKGLSYRDGHEIAHNPDVPANMELDSIPFPARELLSDAYRRHIYWRVGHRGSTDVIITSRGCPYSCNFCFKTSKKFRIRSPENILEELTHIRSQGTKNVHIMDDLFVWNKPRCLKILSMIKQKKLNMEFKVRARVDLIDEELLGAMTEAGVKSVVYGIESGSQKILDAMNKRTTVEMNYRAIEMTKKAGLQCYADAFLGFPGETPETIRETEQLFLKTKPTALNLSVMFPLPNTKVYNDARANGTLIGDWDVHGTRPWIKLPWIEGLGTLNEYRNKVHKRFLRDPVVVFNAARFLLLKISLTQLKMLIDHYFQWAFKH